MYGAYKHTSGTMYKFIHLVSPKVHISYGPGDAIF